jgi:hypothetical protein
MVFAPYEVKGIEKIHLGSVIRERSEKNGMIDQDHQEETNFPEGVSQCREPEFEDCFSIGYPAFFSLSGCK